jgi:hypothetical protein
MPVSRIEYLSVTFLEDVAFGPTVVPSGTTMSVQKDIARGLGRSLKINGPGSADTANFLGSTSGGSPVTVTPTTASVGTTLTAVLAAGWTVIGYQWNRDDSPISGATSATYTLVTADAGHRITLTASGLLYTPAGITVPPIIITIVALDGGTPDTTFVLPSVDGGTPDGTAGSTIYDGGTP